MLSQLTQSQEVWALADCDSFFASCEIARHPEVQGKPVCIGHEGSPIIAASYEAKALGVTTGTAYRDAERILGDDAMFFPPDKAYYTQVSHVVREVLTPFAHRRDVFSIDEAFYDISDKATTTTADAYYEYAKRMQEAALNQLHIPISFGIATTKIRAKMLSNIHKPLGITVALDEAIFRDYFKNTAINKIPFIGKKTAGKIQSLWPDVLSFMDASEQDVRMILRSNGEMLYYELHGISVRSPHHKKQSKSISINRSFHPHFTGERTVLRGYIVAVFDELYSELIDSGANCRVVSITLKDKSFQTSTHSFSLPSATHDREILGQTLQQIFKTRDFSGKRLYRMIGVYFGDLSYGEIEQNLFG